MKTKIILFLSIMFIGANVICQTQSNTELKIAEIEKAMDDKNFQLAIEMIDSILVDSKIAYLYKVKGDAIVEVDGKFIVDSIKLQKALACYEKALEIAPNYYGALYSRGHVYFSHRQFDESLNDLSKCIKISETKKEAKDALNSRALLFSYMRKVDEAIGDYKRVLEIDPEYHMAYSNLSMLYWDMKEYEKAENLILKAIELNENEFKYKGNLALIYLEQDRNEEAETLIKECIANSESPDPYLLNNLGHTEMKLGKYNDAKKHIRESIEIYPDNSYAYRNLALLNIELGKIDEACRDLDTSIKLKFTITYGNEVQDLKDKYCQ